jgi:large subunit ribosomal protein L19
MTVRIEDLQQEGKKQGAITYKAGQTVRVYRKIREGDKERTQMFEGLVIEVKNSSSVSASITVRKIVGGIGVEQVFMVHSPLIEKIELVKQAKVRRSKLYFMRGLRGKAARLKERFYTDNEIQQMNEAAAARDAAGIVTEEPVEQESAEADGKEEVQSPVNEQAEAATENAEEAPKTEEDKK